MRSEVSLPEQITEYVYEGPGVKRPLLLAKVDAVILYFEFATARPKAQLGFHGSRDE